METTILARIKETLSAIKPARSVLFGSHARGTATDDSDYDLLVIMGHEVSQAEKFAVASKIRTELARHLIDVDVIVRLESEVSSAQLKIGSVVREALSQGVIL